MTLPNFLGPSNPVAAPALGGTRTVNLYLEPPEAAGVRPGLYGRPGLEVWADLGEGPVRALFQQDGRAFAVAGTGVFELFGPALFIRRGTVALDTRPASIFSGGLNSNQIGIVSGGRISSFNLASNAFAAVADADVPVQVVMGGHLDGYGVVLTTSGLVRLSALNDVTDWDAADVGTRSQASDTFRALLIDPPYVYLWGELTGEVWENTGTADFPFAPVSGVFLTTGIAAVFSAAVLSTGVAWLGARRGGERVVMLASAFALQPIATRAVSQAIQQYATVADAIGWVEEHAGHEWYALTFPTAGATWVYDVTVSQQVQAPIWYEWPAWGVQGGEEAHLGRCHAVAYGAHLVGSRTDGRVFRADLGVYHDAGQDLRRVRRCPLVTDGHVRLFHQQLELEAEVGTGDGATVRLHWTDDGYTWSSDRSRTLGPTGAYGTRCRWGPLGASRRRGYELIQTDRAKTAWVDVQIDLQRGTS